MNELEFEQEIIEVELTPVKQVFPYGKMSPNDYYIYACETKDKNIKANKYKNVTIKGKMQRLELDMKYKAQLSEDDYNDQYGSSYIVHTIYQDIPSTLIEQKNYLTALLTDLQVQAIYQTYPDEDVIQLIIDNEFDYKKVKGIGKHTYESIRKKVMDNIGYRELFSKLGQYGVTYSVIKKLEEVFGSNEIALQRIMTNPYELCRVRGISFKKADVIARNMGFKKNNPFRIQMGIKFTLEMNQSSGHTYMYKNECIESCSDILQLEEELIHEQLEHTDGLYIEDDRIALQVTHQAETIIVKRLRELMKNKDELDFNVNHFISEMEDKYKDTLVNGLSDQQKQFFSNIKQHPVNLLVGYAGTGKSMMQRLLIDLLTHLKLTFRLMAPTGKAAKVLREYTGWDATTIHRAIGIGQEQDDEAKFDILDDFIIIDETSMLDVFIASKTLNKIKNKQCRILFIGDSFQIASVSAGNVLHDLLESNEIPTTKLDVVFRQSEGGILDIATKIRKGEKFMNSDFMGRQKFGSNLIVHSIDQDHMRQGVDHYYNYFLTQSDPLDVLVLSPTKKSKLGTISINQGIQSIVNPKQENKNEIEMSENIFLRVGDYVINTKNTYRIPNQDGEEVDIVNGDTGVIIDIINQEDKKDGNGIIVKFDHDVVLIPMADKGQLLHAWCLTKHKSQGSAANDVIVIADKAHQYQLNANLLYTAITRARNRVILLCQANVINRVMKKVENMRRNTFLQELLKRHDI